MSEVTLFYDTCLYFNANKATGEKEFAHFYERRSYPFWAVSRQFYIYERLTFSYENFCPVGFQPNLASSVTRITLP
ncbi:hypothetical protein GCM10023210_27980 [Chryseobacterium ginsengisoli]|uniref:PIN domain-containing protein n=1 Tax=Chryseobacterium ginsengisoli TaxID=363853 RepID=A0ABP9MHX4_9FLAO